MALINHLVPLAFIIVVYTFCITDCCKHFMCIVIRKAESCTCSFKLIVRLYCILQAACLTHDRKCSITKAHQLAEPAWFKQRRHQECIRCCVDSVGQRLIIINLCRYLAMIFPVKMTEHILIALFSCSKHYDLYCILTEFIHYICDQVKALLICQTGNDSDQHRIRIFIQSKIFLKLDLILNFFLTESLCIVISE